MDPAAYTGPPVTGFRELAFVKMHGLRNHFAIFDNRRRHTQFSNEMVVAICDPEIGVGAEQLVSIEPPSPEGRAQGALAAIAIFNTDGLEVAACGNATRCVARLLMDETNAATVRIETMAGVLDCSASGDRLVSVVMGQVVTDPQKMPFTRPIETEILPMQSGSLRTGRAAMVGVPHAVFFVPNVDAVDLARDAAPIQNDPLWQAGVNVDVATVTGPDTIRLRVWERPGIATKACGTGACATAYLARRLGLVAGSAVHVELPGGRLLVTFDETGRVTMTGPAEYSFSGKWSPNMAA